MRSLSSSVTSESARVTTSLRCAHTTRVYNLLVHGQTFEKIPVHGNVLPFVDGGIGPGGPDLLALVNRHRPGRTGPAHPCR
jgi:hypothetical protein